MNKIVLLAFVPMVCLVEARDFQNNVDSKAILPLSLLSPSSFNRLGMKDVGKIKVNLSRDLPRVNFKNVVEAISEVDKMLSVPVSAAIIITKPDNHTMRTCPQTSVLLKKMPDVLYFEKSLNEALQKLKKKRVSNVKRILDLISMVLKVSLKALTILVVLIDYNEIVGGSLYANLIVFTILIFIKMY